MRGRALRPRLTVTGWAKGLASVAITVAMPPFLGDG